MLTQDRDDVRRRGDCTQPGYRVGDAQPGRIHRRLLDPAIAQGGDGDDEDDGKDQCRQQRLTRRSQQHQLLIVVPAAGTDAPIIHQAPGEEAEDRSQDAPIDGNEQRVWRNHVEQQPGRKTEAKENVVASARKEQDDGGEQDRHVKFQRRTPGGSVPTRGRMQTERLQEQDIGDDLPERMSLREGLRIQCH
jgi:hypothetical protein